MFRAPYDYVVLMIYSCYPFGKEQGFSRCGVFTPCACGVDVFVGNVRFRYSVYGRVSLNGVSSSGEIRGGFHPSRALGDRRKRPRSRGLSH